MAFKDLRQYISALEEQGELRRVTKEVDWNLEAGAITRLVYEKGLPSPLFENIKDYPGYRILGAPISTFRKLAIALGLSPETSIKELINIYLERKTKLIKPVIVDKSQAPCKENIDIGDQVDLLKFPAPMLHDGDGGRYLCTWQINVTKDPDTGWVNWGCYRSMIVDRKTLAGLIEYQQDMRKHYQKYEAKNEPMPFAIAIGPDPLSFAVSGSSVMPGQSEVDVIGGIRRKPVPLVKCETNDLEVPAGAEIVIEGFVLPHVRVWEGPFGEFTGYRASPRDKRPVYQVTAITYRDDPILTFNCPGIPHADFGSTFFISGFAIEALKRVGINARCWLVPESSYTMMVIAVKNPMPNVATMIKNTLTTQRGGSIYTFKFVVVNDDLDIYDPGEILWAISTRVHPRRGIIVSDEICGPLTPYANLEERNKRNAPHLTFDGTWPLDWDPITATPQVSSFKSIYSQETQDMVLRNWKEYGLD